MVQKITWDDLKKSSVDDIEGVMAFCLILLKKMHNHSDYELITMLSELIDLIEKKGLDYIPESDKITVQ